MAAQGTKATPPQHALPVRIISSDSVIVLALGCLFFPVQIMLSQVWGN